MRILLMLALFIPQLASAGVYMCVDPVTGKKSFTDRACPKSEAGARVKVQPRNFGEFGHTGASDGLQKAWHKQRDTAVSGRANYDLHSKGIDGIASDARTDEEQASS